MKGRTWAYLALGGVAVLALYGWSEFREAEARTEARKAEEARVTMQASIDVQGCGADFPMLVQVKNGATRTVKQVDFEASIFRAGDSSDLATLGRYREWTVILDPGVTGTQCYPIPQSARGVGPLEVRLKASSVSFYETGEFIPRHAASDDAPVPQPSSQRPASPARPASPGARR